VFSHAAPGKLLIRGAYKAKGGNGLVCGLFSPFQQCRQEAAEGKCVTHLENQSQWNDVLKVDTSVYYLSASDPRNRLKMPIDTQICNIVATFDKQSSNEFEPPLVNLTTFSK